ncbi:hypothetical protein [Natronospora cellulosivora (SeqCode)]
MEFCLYLNDFKKDSKKIYESKEAKKAKKLKKRKSNNYEDFRKLLEYPLAWKRIQQKVFLINLIMLVLWIVADFNIYIIIGTIRFLAIEIIILALLYQDKLLLDWEIEGLERPKKLKLFWNKYMIILVILAILIAFFMPQNYTLITFQQISDFFWSLLGEINIESPGFESLREMPLAEEGRNILSSGKESSWLLNLIMSIQFIIYIVLTLIGIALVLFLINIDFDKIANIKVFLKEFIKFFIYFIKTLFSETKKIKENISNIKELIKNNIKKSSKKKEKEYRADLAQARNISQLIRILYKGMLKLLSIKGDKKKKDLTPYEYSSFIGKKYSRSAKEINYLTRLYVENSYSPKGVKGEKRKRLKGIWEKIKNNL